MSASWSRILSIMVVSAWLFVGCSSAKKIDVGGTCVLNSDCNQGLVCTWGKCHVACHTSADCQPGQSCIIASAQSTVCESPTACIYNSDCPTGLICAVDQQCRKQCQTNVDCTSGQICTSTQTCAELSQVDSNNNLLLPDGGVSGSGGASGAGGAGGSGGGEAGVPDAPGTQPDVASGGTGGGGSSGLGGTGGRGEAGVPDAPGTQPDVASGGTGGGGSSGLGGTGGRGEAGVPDAPDAQPDAPIGATDGGAGSGGAGGVGDAKMPDAPGAKPDVLVGGADGVFAAVYYVSPTGSDSNPGTLASPFATVQKGNDVAAAGDTVWLRAGTYLSRTQINLSKSGTSDTNRTKIWAYPGEVPVLDCSTYQTTDSAVDVPCILVTGSWMHLKGLEIANGPVGASGDHSISMLRTKDASNNTFELLNIHHGFGPGLFIDTGTGGNLILNCDSHDNYDKNGSDGDGHDADGFGHHYQTTGPSSTFRGCRTWWNSDNGMDLTSQEVPVTVENCWAFGMGTANYGTSSPSSGNGNGFAIGSSETGIRHLVQNNVAWGNKANGFYANHSSGGNTWYNNTSFQNGTQYNMLASTWDAASNRTDGVVLMGTKVHIMRNNIGYPNKNSYITGYGVDTQFNTWDLNITPAAKDFLSITDPSVSGTGQTMETTSPAMGPRQADGSLPDVDFLKLAAGSQMVDRGTVVGLPYVGAAPDLGAYEYGAAAR